MTTENTLNIDTSNFANDDDYMFLDDPALYIDFHDGNGLNPLGYLEGEKTWKQAVEYAKFETGIPRTEVRRDIIRQEFTLEGKLKQIQPETIALVSQRRYDDSDSEWDRVIIGSAVPEPVYPSVVLIGSIVSGTELRLYIRRLQITAEDFEVVLGAEEHASVPFKGTAQKDDAPLTTNSDWAYNASYADQDNIAFWAWAKSSSGS